MNGAMTLKRKGYLGPLVLGTLTPSVPPSPLPSHPKQINMGTKPTRPQEDCQYEYTQGMCSKIRPSARILTLRHICCVSSHACKFFCVD